jgi:hypothetical protein
VILISPKTPASYVVRRIMKHLLDERRRGVAINARATSNP